MATLALAELVDADESRENVTCAVTGSLPEVEVEEAPPNRIWVCAVSQ